LLFSGMPSDLRIILKKIKRTAKDYNINWLDMVPLFEKFLEKNESKELSDYDEIHFNRKGGEIVSGALFDYLNRSFWEHSNSLCSKRYQIYR